MIIYIIIFLFLALIGLLYVSRIKTEREKTRQKVAAQKRIKDIQSSFKDNIKTLFDQQMITAHQKDRLYTLTSNFFVYQPVNEENINYIERMVVTLSGITSQEMFSGEALLELFKERLLTFTEQLPTSTREYNRGFYRDQLPGLLEALKERLPISEGQEQTKSADPEVEQAVEAVEADTTKG